MNIIFSNGKKFEYSQAYGLERDFKDGYTRPSMEIHMPIAQTSYEEINSIISDAELIKSFTLVGDVPVDENDFVIGEAPTNTYNDYTIKGKVSIEDEILTFKLYKLSDVEIENEQAKQAIDELLIAMEV